MSHRRRRYISLTLTTLALVGATIAITTRPGSHHPTAPTAATGPADVIGRAAPSGKIHLMAFLDTQPDTASTPSRSQAVEIESLLTQYGGKGLTAQIVDEDQAPKNALINTYYDWQLENVRLAGDPGRVQAGRFHVAGAPTTLLIDDHGTVIARWDSYVPTAQAAEAISKALN